MIFRQRSIAYSLRIKNLLGIVMLGPADALPLAPERAREPQGRQAVTRSVQSRCDAPEFARRAIGQSAAKAMLAPALAGGSLSPNPARAASVVLSCVAVALVSFPSLVSWAGPALIAATPPTNLTLIFGAVFLGALVSGLAGFAFSAVAGALLMLILPATQAVPLLLICSIITQLISICSLRRILQWQACLPYLFGGFVGIPAGTYLLQALDARTFAAAFGILLASYSLFLLAKPTCSIRYDRRWADLASGFVGGVTGGAVAFPGAVPTMWCSLRGLAKDMQRGLLQPYILVMQVATLAYFSKVGLLTSTATQTSLWCAPAVLAGTLLGLALFRRVNDAAFRRIVLTFLLISGATLLLK
jgi:uncharacterized membrane protein YfcA